MFDDFVPPPKTNEAKYKFESARPGSSIWVATNSERVSVMRAFKTWCDIVSSQIEATSMTVDETDPRGPGFRIVFSAKAVRMKPAVAAWVPKFDAMDDFTTKSSCLTSDEDVLSAICSVAGVPGSVAEVKAARKLLFQWKTPWQIQRMKEAGLPSYAEVKDHWARKYREQDQARQEAHAWKDDGRPIAHKYSMLTETQRLTARNEAKIFNEEDYLKAMRSRPVGEDLARSLSAVINGYSDFTTWKVQQGCRAANEANAGSDEGEL